ncbi:MAG: RNA methyltransferase [Thermodesulfobacteriota bacterium]
MKVSADVFLALVHYPVYNKHRQVIASALTTIDLHDLARLAATYGLAGFYLTTPLSDQLALAETMLDHWRRGWGARYNASRTRALNLVRLVRDIEEARMDIRAAGGREPLLVGTSAVNRPVNASPNGSRQVSFTGMRKYLGEERPLLILLGTAWGLTDQVLESCDLKLEPVKGPTEYNHLSVRSAAGIILDRLLGR